MEKKPVVKILVCCHKPGEWLGGGMYLPVQCGKAVSEYDLGILGDDTGDNISAKNPNYCELTALYWGWKNLRDADYVGLCHYRRYLRLKDGFDPAADMKGCDIIMAALHTMKVSLAEQLQLMTSLEDFYIMVMAVLKLHPECKPTMLDLLFNSNRCPVYNMMLCRKDVYDRYCEWLFPIFGEMEKWVRLSRYSRLARVYGYFGEALLLVYCRHNGLRIRYSPTCSYQEMTRGRRAGEVLKTTLKAWLKNMAFVLTSRKHDRMPVQASVIAGFVANGIPYVGEDGEIMNPAGH